MHTLARPSSTTRNKRQPITFTYCQWLNGTAEQGHPTRTGQHKAKVWTWRQRRRKEVPSKAEELLYKWRKIGAEKATSSRLICFMKDFLHDVSWTISPTGKSTQLVEILRTRTKKISCPSSAHHLWTYWVFPRSSNTFPSDLVSLPQEFVLASIFLAFHTPLSCQKSHMHKALSCPNRPNTHAAVLEAGTTT